MFSLCNLVKCYLLKIAISCLHLQRVYNVNNAVKIYATSIFSVQVQLWLGPTVGKCVCILLKSEITKKNLLVCLFVCLPKCKLQLFNQNMKLLSHLKWKMWLSSVSDHLGLNAKPNNGKETTFIAPCWLYSHE